MTLDFKKNYIMYILKKFLLWILVYAYILINDLNSYILNNLFYLLKLCNKRYWLEFLY